MHIKDGYEVKTPFQKSFRCVLCRTNALLHDMNVIPFVYHAYELKGVLSNTFYKSNIYCALLKQLLASINVHR